MNFAIDTFSYYMHFGKHWYVPENPVDIRWYCEKSLDLGAKGLHIDPYHITLDKDLVRVKEFANRNDMYIELGACGTSFEELKPAIDAASVLGAGLLRTFVGGDCLDGREKTAIRAARAKGHLPEILQYADKRNISIAIENHGDLFMEDLLSILEIDSYNLGICYDSGNFAFTGEDPLEAIESFGDRIFCTHLKDVCSAENYPEATPFHTVNGPVHFCALGDGRLPMDKIITGLKDQGVGNLTLEICSPCDKSMTEAELLDFEENNVLKSISFIRGYS